MAKSIETGDIHLAYQKENHFNTEKKKKKKIFEKYLQEFMEKFMLWQQGKEINQIVKKQWSGKLELNFNSEKERFESIFKRDK